MHKIKLIDQNEQLLECIEYEKETDFLRILKQFKRNPLYKEYLMEESKGTKIASLMVTFIESR